MDSVSAFAAERINEFLQHKDVSPQLKNKLRQSLAIVRAAFLRYNEEELAMSFNGGKDCLVMLFIILAVSERPLQTVYIRSADTFSQVDEFVNDCKERYKFNMEVSTLPMKEAFASYLKNHQHVKAVFVGIRKADPWSDNLGYMQKTDHGWPDFMRIHPVIDWDYHEVWHFLRLLKIPYCSLYDEGYTSLGSTVSTVPNPSLKREDGSYAPAYELDDPSLERIGRNVKA